MSDSAVILDDKEWRGFIKQFRFNLKDPLRLLQSAGGIFGFKDIVDHFKKAQGPDGKWPKRSQATQRMYAAIKAGKRKIPDNMAGTSRAAFDPGNPLLVMTSKLLNSLIHGRQGRGNNNIKRVGSRGVLLFARARGRDGEYSGKHNRGEGRIPKREFMWLSQTAQERIIQFLADKAFRGT